MRAAHFRFRFRPFMFMTLSYDMRPEWTIAHPSPAQSSTASARPSSALLSLPAFFFSFPALHSLSQSSTPRQFSWEINSNAPALPLFHSLFPSLSLAVCPSLFLSACLHWTLFLRVPVPLKNYFTLYLNWISRQLRALRDWPAKTATTTGSNSSNNSNNGEPQQITLAM